MKKVEKNGPPVSRRAAVLFGGVVVEIALNVDDGGTLVARAGGQVAQGADQVGQAAGRGALGGHFAHQGAVLLFDLVFDGIPQRLAGQGGKVVVRQILELELVGGALQAGGVGRADNGDQPAPRSCPRGP